ncbi:MAG: SLBB domain-containing protein, partial [Armatimonadota bacterium]|nr:SLBB domain-containing protein [Armatimonadota bacterium]
HGFCVNDLINLALGTTPSAARDKVFIERIGDDGRKVALNVNLLSRADNITLKPGDVLVVPSISAFQPMVRLIGEFKGDGVYQLSSDSTTHNLENKSGIYFLKKGQTVKDVIAATGGVTPQADLRQARIERFENGVLKNIPIDLERLLLQNDDTADIVLENGDSLVLPAVADKIHVFGEVKQPGSYAYSPNRRLVDYLGDAGGATDLAKLTEVSVVRGSFEKPKVIKVNAKQAIRGGSIKGNPVLEPGDIVYVPSKFISSWRDATQMILSSLSLITLFRRL